MIPGRKFERDGTQHQVSIGAGEVMLEGVLGLPESSAGIVLFAHGSGSSRFSPRNQYVAGVLQSNGIATLLFDLLTGKEDALDQATAALRFDIKFLTRRFVAAMEDITHSPALQGLPVGCFGASTGAAAALVAAAELPKVVSAVVSRGGRPDLAGDALMSVRAPTLLIVGGNDEPVIELNRQALAKLGSEEKQLIIIPGATHLFEEPGTLEQVSKHAMEWFLRYFMRVKEPYRKRPEAL
jgi:putative phosphoribosyl transferase